MSEMVDQNLRIENCTFGGPPMSTDRAQAHMHAMAALRQATWEATQFLSYDEVRNYVEGVLREVESDEP